MLSALSRNIRAIQSTLSPTAEEAPANRGLQLAHTTCVDTQAIKLEAVHDDALP